MKTGYEQGIYRFLSLYRFFSYGVAVLLLQVRALGTPGAADFQIYLILSLVGVYTLFKIFSPFQWHHKGGITYLMLGGDLLICVTLVLFTEGLDSAFLLYSFAPIMTASLLLDEVKAGEKYELAITNFHGGPFVRYRVGDMIKITSLHNEKLNIDIPQMVFHARVDDMIDIAGFTRLTEKTIWQAIENSELDYVDWTGRKEAIDSPVLHLYIELKDGKDANEEKIAAAVHHQLAKLDGPYAELQTLLSLNPLRVTLLPKGAFRNYISKQREAGADLAHLKPPHLNPSDAVVHLLLNSVSSSGQPVQRGAGEELKVR